MEPFIWYVRPGGKAKDIHGNEIDISQYGVRTGKKGLDFSVYLDSPWKPGETGVSFARFVSVYTDGFKDKSDLGSYLWFLVEQKFGKDAIKRAFEED